MQKIQKGLRSSGFTPEAQPLKEFEDDYGLKTDGDEDEESDEESNEDEDEDDFETGSEDEEDDE